MPSGETATGVPSLLHTVVARTGSPSSLTMMVPKTPCFDEETRGREGQCSAEWLLGFGSERESRFRFWAGFQPR